jgi:hypothetical protein
MDNRELMRRWVNQWAETGKLLEEIHRRELREMTEEQARAASEDLLEIGASHPLSERRRSWSGLIEQQALFHRRPSG